MKDAFRKTIIYLLVACVMCAAGPSASAKSSAAEIIIEAGTGPTKPVDPENPGTEIPGGTEVNGSFVILSVSDFNFDSISASGVTGLYDIKTVQPNIQILDLRGAGTGWSVTASMSSFTSGGDPSLLGASIHIYDGRPNSTAPETFAPSQVAPVELSPASPVKVISAADGDGMGLWVMRWYPSMVGEDTTAYIQLEIPAGSARIGTHTAAITWSLSDGP